MAITQIIGPRIAPLWADPVEWTSTRAYEPFTFVTYHGDSYCSRQDTPIGIDITNDDYWVKVSDYNAQAVALQRSMTKTIETAETNMGNAIQTAQNSMTKTIETAETNMGNAIQTAQNSMTKTIEMAETNMENTIQTAENSMTEQVNAVQAVKNELQAAIDKTQVTFPLISDAISASSLKDNDIVATTGFNSAGVGGGIYRVSESGIANGYTVLACDNGMFLNLMTETNSVFLEQLGADPTGMTPCDSIIKFALDNFKTVIGLNSYRINDTVTVPSNANLYISRLTNAGTNVAVDFSGGYISACIDNLISAGNGVIFGNSADTFRFNVTINKIEASGTNAIILGGKYSAFDGVINGIDAHSQNTPLLVDTSQKFVGQITINNYRLGCDTAGAWLISFPYIDNKAQCSGISLMNLSLEGDFNGINIQGTGGYIEYLYGIGIRFTENSFNNHRSFVHIDSPVSVSGDLFTEWLRAIDAFDSTSSNKTSTLTIHGHIARADFGVYFTQIELFGPIPVLTANSTFQAAYWTRQGDITLQNIVSEVAFYTANTARTITYGTNHISCPANSITVIRSFCSGEGVQVYAFNSANSDIAAFGITEPIWE